MRKIRLRKSIIYLGLASFILLNVHPLYADTAENFYHISKGFQQVLTAGFQIPGYMIQKTLSGPIGVGTVDGALSGTYHAVSALSSGALEMAQGAAPYAKYLVFMA